MNNSCSKEFNEVTVEMAGRRFLSQRGTAPYGNAAKEASTLPRSNAEPGGKTTAA